MEKIIVLSNTVGRTFDSAVKTSAVREFSDLQVITLLTSNECDYFKLVKKISSITSHIFVDLEKKQPLNIKDAHDQKGNLFWSINNALNKLGLQKVLNLYPIKMNDITVNATWKTLGDDFGDISGLRLGLIGTGNIGSKLVSVLTDCGVKLRCFNRDINKAITIQNSVLITKPMEVIASPQVVRKIEHTIINTSGLIVACSDLSEDLSEYISLIHNKFIIYIIGHSILHENSLNKFKDADITIKRIDVGRELLSYIIGTINTSNYKVYGKKKTGKYTLCSGGYIGMKDDIIVDNFNNPNWYYAKCNGKGGVDYIDAKDKEIQLISTYDEIFN